MTDEGLQVRLGDLLHALNKRKLTIALLAAVGLIVGLIASGASFLRGGISRNYSITGSIALNSHTEDGRFSSTSPYPNNSDYHLAEDMATAAIYILTSERTVNQALEAFKLTNVAAKDVVGNLSMTQYEATLIVEEKLYWNDEAEGIAILNALNSVATEVLQQTMNVGGVNLIAEPSSGKLIGGNLNITLCLFLLFMGLMTGVGISVLEFLLRPTLLNTNDIRTRLQRELIGVVPQNKGIPRSEKHMMTIDPFLANVDEAYASIAQVLRDRKGSRTCYFVTSTVRGEGKTNAVARIAIQLAAMEKRVLIADFDFENPHLGSLFLKRVEYDHSLNALYRGEITTVDAITSINGYLDVLPAVYEKNAVLSIDSNLIDLIKKLKRHYDVILLDTAPVGLAANVLQLHGAADAAIMMIRYDHASLREVQNVLDTIDQVGIRVRGCIANYVKESAITGSITVGNVRKATKKDRALRPESVVTLMDDNPRSGKAFNSAIEYWDEEDEEENSEESSESGFFRMNFEKQIRDGEMFADDDENPDDEDLDNEIPDDEIPDD